MLHLCSSYLQVKQRLAVLESSRSYYRVLKPVLANCQGFDLFLATGLGAGVPLLCRGGPPTQTDLCPVGVASQLPSSCALLSTLKSSPYLPITIPLRAPPYRRTHPLSMSSPWHLMHLSLILLGEEV